MIIFGKNESRYLGEGWHERETDGRVDFPYRATKSSAQIRLNLESDTKFVFVLIAAPTSLTNGSQKGVLRLLHNKEVLSSCKINRANDSWGLEIVSVPVTKISEVVFEIKSDKIGIPDKVLHNGDQREFGWMISAIWQRSEMPSS